MCKNFLQNLMGGQTGAPAPIETTNNNPAASKATVREKVDSPDAIDPNIGSPVEDRRRPRTSAGLGL